MKTSPWSSVILTAILGVGSAIAAEQAVEFPTVVVTSTREPLPENDIPDSVAVLDRETLLDHQVRTLPEALSETPGVLVQKTAHGQGSPFVRGFTGYQTLALIDGIRLNNSTFRSGPNQYWNTIDPYSLRQLELLKGQGSVLHGTDAIGGTLNALTVRPDYRGGVGGRLYGRYSTAEDSYTGRVEGQVSEPGHHGLILGVTGKDYGDLRAGDGVGRQPETGYSEYDIDAKFEWFLADDTWLTLAHQQVHQNDAMRTHRTRFAKSFEGSTIGDEQRRSLDQDRYLTYLQLTGTADGVVDSYTVSLSHHRQEEEQDRIRRIGDGRQDISGFTVDTYGAWVELHSDSPVGALTYGASYYNDQVDSFQNNFDADGGLRGRDIQGPVADDSTYHLADAFLQDRIALTEDLDIWLGGRFTYARAEAGRAEVPQTGEAFSFDDDWTHAVGNARFLYHATDAVGFFGGVSQGFRAPNFSDLTRLDTARSDEIETPSPGLDPEEFVSYEIGIRADTERFHGSLAYFYTDIDDLIVGRRTGRVIDDNFEIQKTNAGSGYVQGVELAADYEFVPGWSMFGYFSVQDGQVEIGGVEEPVSRLLPPTGQLGLRWESADGKLWAEAFAQAAAEQDRLTERDRSDTQRIPPGGTPGYVIGSVRGGWQVTDGFRITAAVENVTDETYRVHGSGVTAAGRNLVVSGEWRF